MFCLTPLCIHPYSPPYHTCICKSPHSSLVCYPCILGGLGVPDGIGPFEMHFNAMSSADVFAAFTQSLHIEHHYVRFLITVNVVCSFILPFVVVHGAHPCPI